MQEPNSPLIDSLLTHAAQAARTLDSQSLAEILDAIPAAVYTTDAQGRLTHFNRAAVEFSGRVPTLGTDQWCVTWKLYHADGRPLPHDECPMAVALKEGRPIRGVEAIAERLRDAGIQLHLSEVKGPVMDQLRRSDFLQRFGGLVFVSQYEALRALDPACAERTVRRAARAV